MNSGFARRLTFVTVSQNNISALKDQIKTLYPDLILTVNRDMHRLMSKPLKSYQAKCPENAVGLERLLDEIFKAIQQADQQAGTHESKAKAVLLYGMGGVGKTTLAEAFCAKMSESMSISVAKVAVGLDPNIHKCQETICERLRNNKQRIGDPLEGQDILEDCFKSCSTPVLLYIDNVFRKKDLDNLLPRKLILPPNSYIVVTSRDAEVAESLRKSGVSWTLYDVKGLHKPEAKSLFDHHLGVCPIDKEKKLNDILDVCGGWPLAIEVVGSYLATRKEDNAMWDSAVANLRECKGVSGRVEDQLQEILRWTFKQVDVRCRRIFLDIACLLRNADWEWVRTLGHGSELDTLQALSLVKKVNLRSWEDVTRNPNYIFWGDATQDVVQVHDLLCTLAQQESSFNARISSRGGLGGVQPAISLQDDGNEDENENVEGLDLYDGSMSGRKLNSKHKTLRILRLGLRVNVVGVCEETPCKLQICSVWGYPYRDLSGLHDLRVLDIAGQLYGELNFELVQFPKRLQILQLLSINELQHFHAGAFENCRSLHTVRLMPCSNLEELPASICFCPLRVLLVFDNMKLKYLPGEFSRLQSLETLYLGNSTTKRSTPALPTGLANLKNLRQVYIGGLSDCVDCSHLSRVESLQLDYIRSTYSQKEYHGFRKLLCLKTLHVRNWENLQELSDDLSQLTNLTSLSLAGCKSLLELPKGFQNLHALSKLDLADCKGLQSLPDGICQFTSLQTLDLEGCTSLKEVPKGFGNFPLLSELRVIDAHNLSEGLSRLTSLQKLAITDLESLEKLSLALENLVSLHELELTRCKSPGQFPEQFSRLTCLQVLKVTECEKLPSGWEHLISLSTLTLEKCRNLSRLPGDFSKLRCLQRLEMDSCEALQEFHPEFGNLFSLEEMYIYGCASLRQLPDGFGSLLTLKSLTLWNAARLQHLPDSFSGLKNLRSLDLESTGLEKLPENFGDLTSLTFVWLNGCRNLKGLPDSFVRLKSLTSLNLAGSGLQSLPTDIGNLGALRHLLLSACTDLKGLPESMIQLDLNRLSLRACKPEVQCSQVVTVLNARQRRPNVLVDAAMQLSY